MSLRSFAVSVAAALTIGVLAISPVRAADEIVDGPKINWKIGLWGKPRVNTSHAEALKKVVEARTGGKWTVTLGYDQYGNPKELPDLVKVGALQGAWVYPGYYPDRFPVYGMLDLPFLPIATIDDMIQVHDAITKHPAAQAEAANWGGRFIMAGPLALYEMMGRGKAPLKLADWKGLRVRVPGGMGDGMRRIGAVPTSTDATEVYTSMERGTIDAAGFPGTVSFVSFRVFEVAKWVTKGFALGSGEGPLLINADALAKLPPQYAKLIDEAREVAYENYRKGYQIEDDKNYPMFKGRGIQVISYTDAEMAQFRKEAGEPVWNDWVARQTAAGLPARELLDIVLTTMKDKPKS
jgi:TRAP-type C4-dicarboxylate transport system substrate-binding protein